MPVNDWNERQAQVNLYLNPRDARRLKALSKTEGLTYYQLIHAMLNFTDSHGFSAWLQEHRPPKHKRQPRKK